MRLGTQALRAVPAGWGAGGRLQGQPAVSEEERDAEGRPDGGRERLGGGGGSDLRQPHVARQDKLSLEP